MATYNEKAWAFVRKTKTPFTAWDLARIAQVSYPFARKYVFFLRKAGYLKIVGKKDRERLYRTVKITGTKPVKVNHHKREVIDENTGEIYKVENTSRSEIQQKIWKEILSQKEFTTKDIYQSTYIHQDTIRRYFRFLKKAGYIVEVGKKGKYILYKLKKQQENYPKLNKKVQSVKIKKLKRNTRLSGM